MRRYRLRCPVLTRSASTPTQPSPIEGEGAPFRASVVAEQTSRPNPTELDLFLGFLWASLRGFGGVFVMGRRMLVEENKWLTPDEFVEILGLCQFLPGANIVNVSVAVGQRFRGWRGSLAALAGIVVAPACLSVLLAALFLRYAAVPQVAHGMAAVAAAAAGLVIGTAVKMAGPVLAKDHLLAAPIVLLTLVAAGLLHWPLIVVLLVMGSAGAGAAYLRRAR